ncbi:unnamed protein product, partial [Urochloa humidicola]
ASSPWWDCGSAGSAVPGAAYRRLRRVLLANFRF